jgi:hypothetical protein
MRTAIMIMMIAGACMAADEVKTPVQTMCVEKVCECGGKMRPTGYCLTSNPPQYSHRCDKCGKNETYNEVYPVIRYSEFEAVEKPKMPETNELDWAEVLTAPSNALLSVVGTNDNTLMREIGSPQPWFRIEQDPSGIFIYSKKKPIVTEANGGWVITFEEGGAE